MAIIENPEPPRTILTKKGIVIPSAGPKVVTVQSVARGTMPVEQGAFTDTELSSRSFLYLVGVIVLIALLVVSALWDISRYSLNLHLAARGPVVPVVTHENEYVTDLVLNDQLSFDDRISTKEQESIKEFFAMTPRDNQQRQEVLKTTYERSPQSIVQQVYRIIATTNRKREAQAFTLARSIVSESMRQGYDPLFVAAVIKSESAFNELAVSNVGAQGLMQIMPATGKYLASKRDDLAAKAVRLSDPQVNLTLGIKYLRELEDMYQGNRLLTLIAYNWGPGKLDRAIKSGRGVPAECLRYALKILKDHNYWEFTG